MREQMLLKLKSEFLALKGGEADLDKTLDLIEKILVFTEMLLKDIDELEDRTISVEERQELLEKRNANVLELLQLLIQLSYSEPERALLLLQSMHKIQDNIHPLN